MRRFQHYLCDAALHDEEVWIVHIELHRMEQVLYSPAHRTNTKREGQGSAYNGTLSQTR